MWLFSLSIIKTKSSALFTLTGLYFQVVWIAICSIWSAPWSQVVKVMDEIAITHAKAVQRWKSVFMRQTEHKVRSLPSCTTAIPSEVKSCLRSTAKCFVGFTLLIIRNSDFHLLCLLLMCILSDCSPGTQWPELSTLSLSSHPSVDFIALSAVWSKCSPPNHNLRFFWRTIKRCHTRLLQYCFGLCCQLIKRYLKEVLLTKESSQPSSPTDSEEGAW